MKLSRRGYQLSYRHFYYSYYSVVHNSEGADEIQPPENPVTEVRDISTKTEPSNTLFANMRHGAPMSQDVIFKVRIHAVGSPVLATPVLMAQLAKQPAYARGKRLSRTPCPKCLLRFKLMLFTSCWQRIKSKRLRTRRFLWSLRPWLSTPMAGP